MYIHYHCAGVEIFSHMKLLETLYGHGETQYYIVEPDAVRSYLYNVVVEGEVSHS